MSELGNQIVRPAQRKAWTTDNRTLCRTCTREYPCESDQQRNGEDQTRVGSGQGDCSETAKKMNSLSVQKQRAEAAAQASIENVLLAPRFFMYCIWDYCHLHLSWMKKMMMEETNVWSCWWKNRRKGKCAREEDLGFEGEGIPCWRNKSCYRMRLTFFLSCWCRQLGSLKVNLKGVVSNWINSRGIGIECAVSKRWHRISSWYGWRECALRMPCSRISC